MSHWKCVLGLHDWERIPARRGEEDRETYDMLFDWICLRSGCHATSLDATRLREHKRKQALDQKDRAQLADDKFELLDDC